MPTREQDDYVLAVFGVHPGKFAAGGAAGSGPQFAGRAAGAGLDDDGDTVMADAPGDAPVPDGMPDDAPAPAAEPADVEMPDADADAPEAEAPDTEMPDAEPEVPQPDVAEPEAEAPDTEMPDAEAPDGDPPDAGMPDADPEASQPDAGDPDAAVPDAEAPDGGAPDGDAADGGAPAAEDTAGGDTVDDPGRLVADAAPGSGDAAPTAPSAPSAPPPPAAKPIVLTHLTVASTPTSRTRTKLGVGERVTLTVTPGPGKWLITGGKLDKGTGASVVMTAPDVPGTVDVSVTVGGQQQSVRFNVIGPDHPVMEVVGTRHLANGTPNGAIWTEVYIAPADVSFANIQLLELEIGASAHGYWAGANGHGHGPNPTPLGMEGTVVSGKGTKWGARDNCGIWGGGPSPPWAGDCVFNIPWQYRVGTGSLHGFATVVQSMVVDAAGTMTISKAGASHAFKLTDGASSYPGAPY